MSKGIRPSAFSKISRPQARNIIQRQRLFRLLDEMGQRPIIWVSAPAGSGKSTLISSYLDARNLPCVWYQCDNADSDLATFFYFMGLAAKQASPRNRNPLPLFTPEYAADITAFTRRYFADLYRSLSLTLTPALRTKSLSRKVNGNRKHSPPFPEFPVTKRCSPGDGPAGRAANKVRGEGNFFIVLDNYQDVSSASPFHRMIADGLFVMPEGARVAVISRSGPPPALARLHANDRIRALAYHDIRFTFDELRELVQGRIPKLGDIHARSLYEKTEGWAAGIILMIERAMVKGTGTESLTDVAYDRVFDYFAEEVFSKTEEDVRDFLLKTSFLPAPSVPLAEKLTGACNAGRILTTLNRHHYFTEKLSGSGQDYRYHPLFRRFLLSRAKTVFSPNERAAIQKHAALLLEQSGQREDAARLYRDAGAGDALSGMVLRHAQELLLQGRNRTVEEWISGIPANIADNDPWILYWNGMCSFPFDMRLTRRHLERAFASFRLIDDISGIYLSWAGIVDTLAFGLDEWKRLDDCITVFDDLRKAYPTFPSGEIDLIASSRMLISLTLRKTDQPHLVQKWLEHVSALLQERPSFDIQMDTFFSMSIYNLWKGEYDRNALLLERADSEIGRRRPPPFTVIRVKLMRGIHYWITAQYEAALSTLQEGISISGKSGVHVFDSLLWGFRAAAEIAQGNMDRAEISLKNQMNSLLDVSNALDVFFYHINSAWFSILKGNSSLAAENMASISALVTRMGTPYYRALWNIGMAQVAYHQDRKKDAKALIRSAHRISLTMKSHVLEWYSLLISAFFHLKEGREKEGLLSLRRGLTLGKRYGYVHLEFYQPSVMRFLFAEALDNGIEQEYVKGLIRKLGLTSPISLADGRDSGLYLEFWPYPIKIRTLGMFTIIKDDNPLVFSGKAPKKPLDLLKALIAFGGRNVRIEKLTDALWPDAEGDSAYASFKVHLYHLRKMLGREETILAGESRISLNIHYCHVDALAFQHLAETALETETGAGNADMKRILPLAEKTLALYRGNFLEDGEVHPHIAAFRERLRSRFCRLVQLTGRHYEVLKKWHKAVALYEKGIEADEFREELYSSLMGCHTHLGRYGEAAAVYRRCRKMLNEHFGAEPSADMKAAYEKLSPSP